MSKKVAIIGTVGIPAKYGGFETLTEYLTKYLGSHFSIDVFCSSRTVNEKIKTHNNANLIYLPLKGNGIQSIPYDIISILYAILNPKVNTLLILGVSGAIILPFVRIFSKKRIICNIDGLEWKRDKWNSTISRFLKFSELLAVKYSNHIICDNEEILNYVKKEYANENSSLIAYGADHVRRIAIEEESISKYTFLSRKYAFKVCRIEPENNVALILEAFSLQKKIPLVIIGNWNNSGFGLNLREKYKNFKNIFLLDPIYNQNKLDQLRSNCYVYIHGHSAGGTNPSLVEAMYLELPIFAFDAKYNKYTTNSNAKYFSSKEDLLCLLDEMSDNDLSVIAKKMKEISILHYSWRKIADKYSKLF
jgi:hypothetical protein